MPPATETQLKLLDPYLEGNGPKENGEWDMRCPLHLDSNRSASINVRKGVWICYYGCGSGSIGALVAKYHDWVSPSSSGRTGRATSGAPTPTTFTPTAAHVAGWASALLDNRKALADFVDRRGLTLDTIKRFDIGWAQQVDDDQGKTIASRCYTIPIYGVDGEILNIRFYQLDPDNERRKIWSVPGMGQPHLYPLAVLESCNGEVVKCEGELDALIAIQNGFPTITVAAGATTWNVAWNPLFKDKVVYLIHDADDTGRRANSKLQRMLRGSVEAAIPVSLPFKHRPKHGQDLTDFFAKYGADDLRELMEDANAKSTPDRPVDLDPADASILDTLDSSTVGQPQRIVATVRGKAEPGYSIPRTVEMSCSTDRGEAICQHCPMFGLGGRATVKIEPDDPLCLALVDATKAQVIDAVREKQGALKCNRITIDVKEHQAVETLFVRPSVDHVRQTGGEGGSSRKITSVGKHDTRPNTTVRITGALHPDPRRQRNEFLAWVVEEQETSLDRFSVEPWAAQLKAVFSPAENQRPLAKRVEVARTLAREVTGIHQRDEMHVAMDMVWHSALSFVFDGQPVDRGWVELLIVGDTRTGKSEVLQTLSQHYQSGEIVDCKAASFAGVVGGLQQFAGSNEYVVNWGVVPTNDRRLVGMEEASGLSVEDIAKLSSVRSSGVAKITKIEQDATSARTRLIWLANPRNHAMIDYLYGVDAIKALIGNDEDIARFTLAMAVRKGEVPMSVINGPSKRTGDNPYTSELCSQLVMWAWSRKREQVVFTPAATRAIYVQATKMGTKYVEVPPLVQAANIRIKIASMSVALAASVFSTDETHEQIVVDRQHVLDAVKFMDHVYAMPSFGYLERSNEALADDRLARKSTARATKMLAKNPELRQFLRMQTRFKRQDIEEVLAYTREAANETIKELHEYRMIKKQAGFVVVSPVLHDILRNNNG